MGVLNVQRCKESRSKSFLLQRNIRKEFGNSGIRVSKLSLQFNSTKPGGKFGNCFNLLL